MFVSPRVMQVIVITTWLVSIMILALDLYIKGELEKEILNTTRMDFAFKLVPAVIGMVLVAPFLVSALFLTRALIKISKKTSFITSE